MIRFGVLCTENSVDMTGNCISIFSHFRYALFCFVIVKSDKHVFSRCYKSISIWGVITSEQMTFAAFCM